MRTAEQTKRKKIRLIVKEYTVSRILSVLYYRNAFRLFEFAQQRK